MKSEVKKMQLAEINIEYLLTSAENKETILFVHGLGANLSQFEKQHQYFQDRYKTLSISLRGHGNSSSSRELTESDFELSRLADDIILLIDSLGIDKFHFVGNSMGGNIGYELMKTCPDRLLSFTSFGTTSVLKKSGFIIRLLKFTYKLMSMKTIAKLSGSAGVNESSKTKIVEMMSQAKKSTVLNLIPYLGDFDYLEVIKHSQIKAQIIRGDKDKEINKVIESTIETFEQRGDFSLIDLENSGHFANLDNPDLFNITLETFLNSLNE
ncbi:MAG: alpha/beta hydrolase [Bacteroidales bacterium]|nr:alpha/beta hydrolase [Bacteroidales bacterium]